MILSFLMTHMRQCRHKVLTKEASGKNAYKTGCVAVLGVSSIFFIFSFLFTYTILLIFSSTNVGDGALPPSTKRILNV